MSALASTGMVEAAGPVATMLPPSSTLITTITIVGQKAPIPVRVEGGDVAAARLRIAEMWVGLLYSGLAVLGKTASPELIAHITSTAPFPHPPGGVQSPRPGRWESGAEEARWTAIDWWTLFLDIVGIVLIIYFLK